MSDQKSIWEGKIQELEFHLEKIRGKNKQLKTQNEDLKNSLIVIKKEMTETYEKMKGIAVNIETSIANKK